MDACNFDDEFKEAVAEWRERHGLAEGDAVLLLIELFRLHQRHWDELRRRELPSFEPFRSDITKLSETTKSFHQQSAGLIEVLRLRSAPGCETARFAFDCDQRNPARTGGWLSPRKGMAMTLDFL